MEQHLMTITMQTGYLWARRVMRIFQVHMMVWRVHMRIHMMDLRVHQRICHRSVSGGQKYIAQEEEKKVQQINEKGSLDLSTQLKKKTIDRKQNNYASVDCGANIPEMNSEAQNAHSILLENKDLYMLNPCSANIWFIVELCDHVHVTSLQLANFEMFSSTIEKFQVSFSTRYPTREWSQLQTFTAKLEKSIQTFTIDPIFAKYIKVRT